MRLVSLSGIVGVGHISCIVTDDAMMWPVADAVSPVFMFKNINF